MKKIGRKALSIMLGVVLCVSALAFTGCGGGSSSDPASSGLVDSDIKGDISIMTWGGDDNNKDYMTRPSVLTFEFYDDKNHEITNKSGELLGCRL